MSKRLLTLITVLLLLVVSSVAYGQETASGEPIFVLTEEQINAEFTIPSTATRTVSNLEVDVQEDGVHISFDLTAISDGTSNTLSIIAILIGLVQPEVSALELENTLVSNFTASPRQRQEVSALATRAWRNYVRNEVEEQAPEYFVYEEIIWFFVDDGIYVYETEGVTAQ